MAAAQWRGPSALLREGQGDMQGQPVALWLVPAAAAQLLWPLRRSTEAASRVCLNQQALRALLLLLRGQLSCMLPPQGMRRGWVRLCLLATVLEAVAAGQAQQWLPGGEVGEPALRWGRG